jgi:hypothetical protein
MPEDEEALLRHNQIHTNRITSTIGILLLVANLIALGLTAWQARISQQASAAADASVKIAREGVDVSRDTLDAMRESDKAQRKNDAVQRKAAAEESEAQIKQIHVDDRAWIVPEVTKLHEVVEPSTGKSSGFYMYGIGVRNVGKTLGKKIIIRISKIPAEGIDQIPPWYIKWEEEGRLKTVSDKDPHRYEQLEHLALPSTLVPGASSIEPARIAVQTPQDVGQNRLSFEVIVGRLEYEDIFGGEHWAGFCYLIDSRADLMPCPSGNEQEN